MQNYDYLQLACEYTYVTLKKQKHVCLVPILSNQ